MGPALRAPPPARERGRILSRLPRLMAEVRSHPAWLPVFVMGRLAMARSIMCAVANWTARRRDAPIGEVETGAVGGPVASMLLADLRQHGIAAGLMLPPSVVADVRAFAESGRPCHGGADWNLSFVPEEHADAERRFGVPLLVGHYDQPDLGCEAISRITRERVVWEVAREYLGSGAQLIDVRLWWSFASSKPRLREQRIAAQDIFHFDLADWSELKFFFYITDVGPENGPHRFVRGSHRSRSIREQVSPFVARRESALSDRYGPEAIIEVTGPAGSGIVEDPFGYHTGTVVREGRRLMLELSFGVTGVRCREHLRKPLR